MPRWMLLKADSKLLIPTQSQYCFFYTFDDVGGVRYTNIWWQIYPRITCNIFQYFSQHLKQFFCLVLLVCWIKTRLLGAGKKLDAWLITDWFAWMGKIFDGQSFLKEPKWYKGERSKENRFKMCYNTFWDSTQRLFEIRLQLFISLVWWCYTIIALIMIKPAAPSGTSDEQCPEFKKMLPCTCREKNRWAALNFKCHFEQDKIHPPPPPPPLFHLLLEILASPLIELIQWPWHHMWKCETFGTGKGDIELSS